MIATSKDGFCLVECHFPTGFLGITYPIDLRDEFNRLKKEEGCASRFGSINTNRKIDFYISEIGTVVGKGWRQGSYYYCYFEMYITIMDGSDVFDCLAGKHGNHFFVLDIDIKKYNGYPEIKSIKRPILMADGYPGYQDAMDGVFGGLVDYFHNSPDPTILPITSLH